MTVWRTIRPATSVVDIHHWAFPLGTFQQPFPLPSPQCLTVPAMWSDRAKSIMRQAAVQAGLISPTDHHDRLMLISEPEAAALYCERKCEQYRLNHGDRFMICDCGGGTVDLIVFEIEESEGGGEGAESTAKNRKLKEVTRGHGQSCGSVFLDKNMRELLKTKFSQHTQEVPEAALAAMMDEFIDLIKPNFDGVDEQFLKLPAIPGLDDLTNDSIGLEDGVLCLTAQEIKDLVFEPVILDILNLIREQLRQSPRCDAIFLVGGFGTSNYLHQRVDQEFGRSVGIVAMPPRAELAVVRGAVYFGLDPKIVTARMSRRTYGLVVMMPFEEGVDPESEKIVRNDGVWCDNRFSGRFMLFSFPVFRFTVYVKKGETIGINECIPKSFFAFYPNDIYSPLYAYDGPEDSIPRYTTHAAVKKVAEFTIPMPYLPNVKKGERVDYRTKLYFGLTEIRAEAVIHGKTYVTKCVFDANDEWSRPVVKD
ncbi:hypothetical protein BC936DRAFT_139176 [Jimgerdemannia flammicorona]|nr:hypothetical protein BC936DRAFT_139176 [Jimgerdemannia flammicorona]